MSKGKLTGSELGLGTASLNSVPSPAIHLAVPGPGDGGWNIKVFILAIKFLSEGRYCRLTPKRASLGGRICLQGETENACVPVVSIGRVVILLVEM